ncbi:MAG: beta-ketoacyl-ACP synthase II [Thermodesulfovibrionales bacterium]
MRERVVITGMAAICSLGHELGAIWDALLAGRSGVRPVEGFDASGLPCRFAAQVAGFDPSQLKIHPRVSRIMDLHSQLLMHCTRSAHADARLPARKIDPNEIGYVAGMGMVDYRTEDLLPAVAKSLRPDGSVDDDIFYSAAYQEIYPLWPLSMLNNIGFCQVATDLDIRGENTVFCAHADSGGHAVIEGMETVREHKAAVMLCGGVSEKVSPQSIARGVLKGVLATDASSASTACSPFNAASPGTVLGEGSAILALELQSSADRAGLASDAEISGYGYGFGLDSAAPAPSVASILLAMRNALASARCSADAIDAVIACGDGTRGDVNEAEAIGLLFGDPGSIPPVYSSKGAVGDLLAAAPAFDIALAALMLRHGIVPPTAHAGARPGNAAFTPVSGSPLAAELQRILVNCRSYEGQCVSFVIERPGGPRG